MTNIFSFEPKVGQTWFSRTFIGDRVTKRIVVVLAFEQKQNGIELIHYLNLYNRFNSMLHGKVTIEMFDKQEKLYAQWELLD